jgi:hypothetical protein
VTPEVRDEIAAALHRAGLRLPVGVR